MTSLPHPRPARKRVAAYSRRDESRRSPRPDRRGGNLLPPPQIEEDAPDDRYVFQVYGDELPPSILPPAAGFEVLSCWWWQGQLQCAEHPVIAWRLLEELGPLPIGFGTDLKFHRMGTLALRSPDGSVVGFDGGCFSSSKAWLANRRRLLREDRR